MSDEKEVIYAPLGLLKKAVNGVKKDPVDERDYIFKAPKEIVTKLPRKVDLRQYSGEIENQLTLGSCVANATCSSLELMAKMKERGVKLYNAKSSKIIEQDASHYKDPTVAVEGMVANKIMKPVAKMKPVAVLMY